MRRINKDLYTRKFIQLLCKQQLHAMHLWFGEITSRQTFFTSSFRHRIDWIYSKEEKETQYATVWSSSMEWLLLLKVKCEAMLETEACGKRWEFLKIITRILKLKFPSLALIQIMLQKSTYGSCCCFFILEKL